MVTVAGHARWGAQVAPYHDGVVMHALAIIGVLAGGDFVCLHVLRIGMAACAGLGNIYRID